MRPLLLDGAADAAGPRREGEDGVEFRLVGPGDEALLVEMFAHIDDTFFRPHPFTPAMARRIARRRGRDAYAMLVDDGGATAYGMLRGWDEGYHTPSLGIAVRTDRQGQGLGRLMMLELHRVAAERGAPAVRLRVHPDNVRARRLYETLGYAYTGHDRGELVMEAALPRAAGLGDAPSTGLTAELLTPDNPRWATFLDSTQYDFYHLPDYAALSASQEAGMPQGLLVEGDRGSMLLPIIVREISPGRRDAVSPYGYPGPLVGGTDDPAFLREALAVGIHALRAAGFVSLFIRFHPLLNGDPPQGLGTMVRHGDTVSIDLSLSEDELWRQTRENHRRNIVRARGLGYVASMDGAWSHFEAFKHLYRLTMERNNASAYYRFDDRYFDGLRRALGERLHL
jgi:RimJ/RimL family protein N-acetyltransferase